MYSFLHTNSLPRRPTHEYAQISELKQTADLPNTRTAQRHSRRVSALCAQQENHQQHDPLHRVPAPRPPWPARRTDRSPHPLICAADPDRPARCQWPGPDPRRETRPPGIPAGALRRRNRPPRHRRPGTPSPPRPLRTTQHLRGLRLHRQPETARRDAARPVRAALARRRRIGHPLRTGRGWQNPCRTKHSDTKSPDAAATSGSSNAPGCSPTSPAATPIAPSVNACVNTPARSS